MREHGSLHRVSRVSLAVASIGLVAMTAILCWQVFARYVLDASPAWSEQASLVLMMWFVFLGAASGVWEGRHIRIEEGVTRMNPRLRRWAHLLANVAVLLLGLELLIWGSEMVVHTWDNHVPTLPLTRGMVNLVIPVFGGLMALFSLFHALAPKSR